MTQLSDAYSANANPQTWAVTASYVTDPGGLLATRTTSTTYSYVNGHGDVVQRANSSGVVLEASPLAYDEFGVPVGTSNVPYGWTGLQRRPTSPLTGVIRMGVRLYDPVLGRFLSRDPIEGGSLNDYEYAGGDPVNGFDLDGRVRTSAYTGRKYCKCGPLYSKPQPLKYGCKAWGTSRVFRWIKGTRVLWYVDVFCIFYGWFS